MPSESRKSPALMGRSLRTRSLLAMAGVVVVAMTSSCKKDIQLSKPELDGPLAGQTCETLAFTVTFTDPADHDVAYEFAWGDSSHLEWTPYYPSGQPVVRTHAYSDTGIYNVRAKAKGSDQNESKWSDVVDVAIGLAPTRPELSGRSVWFVAEPCSITARSFDPQGRRLTYGFSWGDGSPVEWSDTVDSDTSVTLVHTYDHEDTFPVCVEARNERGLLSGWSDPFPLRVQQPPSELVKPTVYYEAIDIGAELRLHWTAVPYAVEYEVDADETTFTTQTLYFDVPGPAKLVKVYAVAGNVRSDPTTIDCGVVETASLVLYGISDPDPNHTSGLAFSTNGSASALTLDDANKASLDFVCDDSNVTPVGLVNAGDYGWYQNSEINSLMDAGTTDYDAFGEAAGSGYTTQLGIRANGVYALWLSRTQSWTTSDHFCKAKIISIEDVGGVQKVTLKVGYQLIGGLRWVKSQ